MTSPDELAAALAAIGAAFDAMGVTWAVGGSIASSAYGEPRATNDIDLIARLTESDARDLAVRLGADFYADPDMMASAARDRSSFNVIDKRSMLKIDVFVPGRGPLGTGQLDRRVWLALTPGMKPWPVLGPEDVLLQKLRWFELGGSVSDRQWRDIVAVLRATGRELDETYLTSTADGEGLTELLARARADAARA